MCKVLVLLLATVIAVNEASQPAECLVDIKDSLLRGFPVVFYTYIHEINRCALRFSTNVWSGSPNVFFSASKCIKTCCPASCRPHCCKGHLDSKAAKSS